MDDLVLKFSQWAENSPAFAQVKTMVDEVGPKNLKKGSTLPAPGFPEVGPLMTFNWEKTEPLKLRPFKPKYNMTMSGELEMREYGPVTVVQCALYSDPEDNIPSRDRVRTHFLPNSLETLNPSELIPIDKTYKERIELRRELFKSENRRNVVGVNDDDDPRIRAAVSELYTFIMGTYLPGRYPQMFKIHTVKYEQGASSVLHNMVTGEIFPTIVSPTKSTEGALETLGSNVDEDLLILLPEEKKDSKTSKDNKENDSDDDVTKYRLEAFQAAFPSGFDPAVKLGNRLNIIHGPVPGYEEKLGKSMDRYFGKLEVGKYVKRSNWSITTDGGQLFSAFRPLHGHEGEALEARKLEKLDAEKTHLRCERQTLHRLPKSKALVFGIHTYLYPIQEIKDEGSGEELIEATEGLAKGNNPDIQHYKLAPVWSDALKTFMRE
ncbi:hypothetical protein FQN54_003939 [Arachnomyces sp. PD_36]|nr:hypothetical protein FQN54_003939 [Arachnomyces sp. PD_36]